MTRVTRMLRRLRAAAPLAALALLAGCWFSGEKVAGGDATETGNAVAGQILLEGGGPAVGARVTLLPWNYNPVDGGLPDSLSLDADAQGRFKFTGVEPGQYNVEALHGATRTRLLILGVETRPDKAVVVRDSLRPTGSLSVPIPETPDSGTGYVFVPGSTFKQRIDSEKRLEGRILLDSLPEGAIPAVEYVKEAGAAIIPVSAQVTVQVGVTYTVPPFFAWRHSAKVVLNTSATGVPIAQGLRDFPLLVRLAAPAFDFSQALGGGADLRFADSSGAVLAHEIEDWDSAAGHADVWVRVDSVAAGAAGQSLSMYWGNSRAQAPQGGRPVFDAAGGFAGVWHLEEEAPDTVANGLYRDATPAGNQGNDRVTSTDRSGVIGFGHGIAVKDYIQAPNASAALRLANAFTLSLWFRSGGPVADSGSELISVGDNYGLRLGKSGNLHIWFWPPLPPPAPANKPWYSYDTPAMSTLDNAWHYVEGVFDGASLHLYVDGKDAGGKAAVGPVDFKYPMNMTLGTHGAGKTGYYFTGNLDEVRIHSAARGADWTKLSYENQRPGSAFPALVPQ